MPVVKAVCLSEKKHTVKVEVERGWLEKDLGLKGDAHAGSHRQVSLLAYEDVLTMKKVLPDLKPGDFAENLTTQGIELSSLPVGTRLKIGSEAVLQVTQIGKKCHGDCEIFKKVGKCVMPKKGIFARVVVSGEVIKGDPIEVLS